MHSIGAPHRAQRVVTSACAMLTAASSVLLGARHPRARDSIPDENIRDIDEKGDATFSRPHIYIMGPKQRELNDASFAF